MLLPETMMSAAPTRSSSCCCSGGILQKWVAGARPHPHIVLFFPQLDCFSYVSMCISVFCSLYSSQEGHLWSFLGARRPWGGEQFSSWSAVYLCSEVCSDDVDNCFVFCVSVVVRACMQLPDYHEIIEHPMDFSTIREKLLNDSYTTLEQFEVWCL